MMRGEHGLKEKRIRKILALILAAVLMMCMFSGCGSAGGKSAAASSSSSSSGSGGTYIFTDSCGRQVKIPKKITRVAPSGATAQMVLMTIAPETLVGLSNTPSVAQRRYFPKKMWSLPTFGQFYGSKANMNMESLIDADPQVIIDIGDKKTNHKDDMNLIQKQTGIPTIFIEATLDKFPGAYRTLGKVLGKEKKGERLAEYIENTLDTAEKNAAKIKKKDKLSVLYGTGSTGLACNAKYSIQADVIEKIGAKNAIVVDQDEMNNAGGGTIVSMEEVYKSDPDALIFTSGGPYDSIASGAKEWKQLGAVKKGRYYEIPNIPYCWMSNPPSVNRIIGIWWLGNLLYPDIYDYNMISKAKKFYKLFYNYDLSTKEAKKMLGRSTLK